MLVSVFCLVGRRLLVFLTFTDASLIASRSQEILCIVIDFLQERTYICPSQKKKTRSFSSANESSHLFNTYYENRLSLFTGSFMAKIYCSLPALP